jgi:heptaprenyl diphosphate synthase
MRGPKGLLARFRGGYQNGLTGEILFFAGLLLMPALVFNPSTPFRLLQFLYFWLLALLAGKKTRPLLVFFIFLGIMAFNLLVPYGRILFFLGPLRITSGALDGGLRRAATLEGLVMLSRLCVRPDLRLPGAFGALAGESLRVFARMSREKRTIRWHSLVADLDRLLWELSAPDPAGAAPPPVTSSRPGAVCVLFLLAVPAYLPWLAFLPL